MEKAQTKRKTLIKFNLKENFLDFVEEKLQSLLFQLFEFDASFDKCHTHNNLCTRKKRRAKRLFSFIPFTWLCSSHAMKPIPHRAIADSRLNLETHRFSSRKRRRQRRRLLAEQRRLRWWRQTAMTAMIPTGA